MAKRRDRRKRQSSAALRQNGLRAFGERDYTKAIAAWERVRRQTPDMLPPSALAEAYFRRGVRRIYEAGEHQAGLKDLNQVAELQPDDPRTTYHLGLAVHRQGDLEEAIHHYEAVRQGGGEFARRAAYPLALALLQCGEDPARYDIWHDLQDGEQVMLDEVSTFKRRPYTLSDQAPPLWRAMAVLDAGEDDRARAALDTALEEATGPVERQLAHYYRGVLAAQEEDWEKAMRAWNAARAAGLRTERLETNLQEGYHRLAEERLAREDVEGALLAGEEALRHGSSYPSLEELVSQAHQRLAHRAASDGRWAEARDHWEAADATEDGSFRLAYNLALAYERSEEFLAAGERWREALRRRPRRADHPDALSDDQVARLWQRAAEAYAKAGHLDEAIQVHRNALKWNPDHLETRLTLADALLLNDQSEAAENELRRILDRDPDYIPALIRMGQVVSEAWPWWWGSPIPYWERVLELDPDHAVARRLLVDYCQEMAGRAAHWGEPDRALELYQNALEHEPGSARVLAALGSLHLRLGEREKAEPYVEEALERASDDLVVYETVIRARYDVDDPAEAWRVMGQAEEAVDTIPYEFYIAQASYCIDYVDEAVPLWLDRAVEKAPPGAPVFVVIGEMALMNDAFDLAQEYLERAIASDQAPGQAHLLLGIIAVREGDTVSADMHWNDAMRIARRDDDEDLMERVEGVRSAFYAPPELLDLIDRFGPDPFGDDPFSDFPEFLDDDLDDDVDEWW